MKYSNLMHLKPLQKFEVQTIAFHDAHVSEFTWT